MKKYIRTKDGYIFEIKKDLGKYGKSKAVIICDFNGNVIDVRQQNNILKQADTIEELCDEYVAKHINSLIPTIIDKFTISLKEIKTQYSGNDNFEYVYGAIWTDKGLIYVAKMNDKGELELVCHD